MTSDDILAAIVDHLRHTFPGLYWTHPDDSYTYRVPDGSVALTLSIDDNIVSISGTVTTDDPWVSCDTREVLIKHVDVVASDFIEQITQIVREWVKAL